MRQVKDSAQRLATLFSAEVFRSLGAHTARTAVRAIADSSELATLRRPLKLRTMYDRAYDVMRRFYPCEYVYKNTITNTVLLSNHNLDSARLLTEFRVGDVRMDLGVINGTSTAYEVKTSLDKLERLPNQLAWYSKLFDHIVVVTSESMRARIEATAPAHVGVSVLTDDGKLAVSRSAASNKANIDVRLMSQSLRELEILEICRRISGLRLDLPNTTRADACWEILTSLTPVEAHDQMVCQLRRRPIHHAQRALVEAAPFSLKHLCLGKVATVSQYRLIQRQLDAVA